MFEDNVLERDGPVLESVESPQSVTAPYEPKAVSEKPVGRERKAGFLRRRPIVSAIGALLFALALGGGYLYLDYTERFQSTDDAFIAARQFSLAPKVSEIGRAHV